MATSSHYERSAKDMNIQKIRDRANVRFFVCVCLSFSTMFRHIFVVSIYENLTLCKLLK